VNGVILVAEVDMETQNMTLALPRRVLRQIKTIAARRRTSVSRLLTEQLEAIIAQEQDYSRARTRHLAVLKTPPIWAPMGGFASCARRYMSDRLQFVDTGIN
jgi:hypothetical protein